MWRRCRVCGCTDEQPCAEGCDWVADDLCSACATPKAMDFWEQFKDFEARYSGDTPVIVWGPMGQQDEMPLAIAGIWVKEIYDDFDAHNCGLALAGEEGNDVV